jgi:hypothetical protein
MAELCRVCQQYKELMEDHHVHPVHLGGAEDGPTIRICGECHTGIHHQALAWTAKSKEARERVYFTSPATLERARPFINVIVGLVKERGKSRMGRGQFQENEATGPTRRMLRLDIDNSTWATLHKVKADKGYTNMNKFLTDLLKRIAKGHS